MSVSAVYVQNENITTSLKRAIDLLGGLNQFVKRDDKILLKPNFFVPIKSACTSSKLIEAVIQTLQEVDAEIIIGEGSGVTQDTDKVYKALGVDKLAEKYGIELIDFDDVEKIVVSVPNGKAFNEIELPKIVLERKIINLPILKTHNITGITCCMKNLKGCLPKRYKTLSHIKGVHQAIVDINNIIKPALNIVDALEVMEDFGPTYGNMVKANLIIVGESALLVDYFCCQLFCVPLHSVRHLESALKGICPRNDDLIKVIPTDATIPELNIQRGSKFYLFAYRLVHLGNRICAGKLFPFLSRHVGARPTIDTEKCKDCQYCLNVCPIEGAIDLKNKRIDRSKCVKCFLCMEFCPTGAIKTIGLHL